MNKELSNKLKNKTCRKWNQGQETQQQHGHSIHAGKGEESKIPFVLEFCRGYKGQGRLLSVAVLAAKVRTRKDANPLLNGLGAIGTQCFSAS